MKQINDDYIKEKGWWLNYWKEKNSYYIAVKTTDNFSAVIARYDIRTDSIVLLCKLPLNVVSKIYECVDLMTEKEKK